MTTTHPTVTTETPAPAKLPSNAAVRAIKAYWIELCAEKGLDPHTGKPLARKKIAHARRADRARKVPAVNIS